LVLEGNGLAHKLQIMLNTIFNIGVVCLGPVPWLSAHAMHSHLGCQHIKLGELSAPQPNLTKWISNSSIFGVHIYNLMFG